MAEKINQDNHQLSASQLNLSLHQFGDNVNNGDRDKMMMMMSVVLKLHFFTSLNIAINTICIVYQVTQKPSPSKLLLDRDKSAAVRYRLQMADIQPLFPDRPVLADMTYMFLHNQVSCPEDMQQM